MNEPKHHPSDATIMAYSAGSLNFACMVVVERHMRICSECAAKIAVSNQIGALILAELPPAELACDAVSDALDRIDRLSPNGSRSLMMKYMADFDLSPTRLYRIGPSSAIKHRTLWRYGESRLDLVQLAPGAAVPQHKHDGMELVLMLDGEMTDCRARYSAGDVCEADPDVDHEPRATGDKPALYLMALEGKQAYRSWLQRIRRFVVGI